jgi:hypothetical protein
LGELGILFVVVSDWLFALRGIGVTTRWRRGCCVKATLLILAGTILPQMYASLHHHTMEWEIERFDINLHTYVLLFGRKDDMGAEFESPGEFLLISGHTN